MYPISRPLPRAQDAHPDAIGDISGMPADNVDRLLKALCVLHCSLPALLGALQHTCSNGECSPDDPATVPFEQEFQKTRLAIDEMATLRDSLIMFLPLRLQTEARALVSAAHGKGPQSAEHDRLTVWLASNLRAAKLLDYLPDPQGNPVPTLQALAYAWGRLLDPEFAHGEFRARFDASKAEHLRGFAPDSAAFVKARNAFNDAVRLQLVDTLPEMRPPYQGIQASVTGYENKRKAVLTLIHLYKNISSSMPLDL